MLIQRLRGKPVAYIIGEWSFYGYDFHVTSDVLIPRSDTECLCDAAIREAKKREHPQVLDLCCGSGCIGIVLAKEVPDAVVAGVDISAKALEIARGNAARHRLEENRYTARWGDVRRVSAIPGKYDILVCNPPYIPAEEMKQLDPGVRDVRAAPRAVRRRGRHGLLPHSRQTLCVVSQPRRVYSGRVRLAAGARCDGAVPHRRTDGY